MKINIAIIGGGMITKDQILPTVYHLQRIDRVGSISVAARHNAPLRALKDNKMLKQAFPGQGFDAYPAFSEPANAYYPKLYEEVISQMMPRQAIIVAVPDQVHYPVIRTALENNQHILCVKPLVLKYEQSLEIKEMAFERGLFIGVEYHKRFDRRALITKGDYEQGKFGEFKIGEAKMIEPYSYRSSNFQNWFTTENTDPFVYIGCHYVDLVYFITGLKPTKVAVVGVKGRFPNGNEGFTWASACVRFENGALLSVTSGLGYPDAGGGANEQCLTMFCESNGKTAMIKHDDHYRGVSHCYLENLGVGGTKFNYINPDFFQLVPWEENGYKPVGYGYDSVSSIIDTIYRIERDTVSLPENEALKKRREMIRKVDEAGFIATPANSYINELVTETARLSILNDGQPVEIVCSNKR